jgi:hypothetical protein
VTSKSSSFILGRGDLRGTLGYQNNTLRGVRACLFYRLGILNILWQEKGSWKGWALGKIIGKEDGGWYWTLVRRSLGLGRYTFCFPNIPVFALFQCFSVFQQSRLLDIYVHTHTYIHIDICIYTYT